MSVAHCGNGMESDLFALSFCPLRLDLHDPFFAIQVVAETAPRPIFRLIYQPTSHWVPMDIPQLPDPLALTPDIKVVIATLPEMVFRNAYHASDSLLHRLNESRKLSIFWFVHQKVDVFRHDNVPVHAHPKTSARYF